ncbi:MAG: FctA domain-containing protein [Anaerococcus sp.]|nr:FctA domain-containing protein [Anaerococcus sp.]
MKKYVNRIKIFFLILITLTPIKVYGASYVDIYLPLTVKTIGDNPDPRASFILENKLNEPMPEQDIIETYKNNDDLAFGPIRIDRPGIYNYKVYQNIGSDEKLSYDETTYNIQVVVETDMENYIIAYKSSSDLKSKVYFENTYLEDNKNPTSDPAQRPKPGEDKNSATNVKTGVEGLWPLVILALLAGGLVYLLARRKKK